MNRIFKASLALAAIATAMLTATTVRAATAIKGQITFDLEHKSVVDRTPTGAGVNQFRGYETADRGYNAQVGLEKNISSGGTSVGSKTGPNAWVDLSGTLGCSDSVRVDIDGVPGCDGCYGVPDLPVGTPENPAGLADSFIFWILGENFDDLPVGCVVDVSARLNFIVDNQQWELWWGPHARPGGDFDTMNPGSPPISVRRVSNQVWHFQTTGDSNGAHLAALYREESFPHQATEYHGQVRVKFSGAVSTLENLATPAPADCESVVAMVPGATPCQEAPAGPSVVITSPVDGSTFSPGTTVNFTAAATDGAGGDLSAQILWFLGESSDPFGDGSTASLIFLGPGTFVIHAEVSSANVSDTLLITIAELISVSEIRYITSGKNLLISVLVLNSNLNPVNGASVTLDLYRNSTLDRQFVGTTGSDGWVTFQRSSAPKGTYTAVVRDVSAAGYTWDELTPPNSHIK